MTPDPEVPDQIAPLLRELAAHDVEPTGHALAAARRRIRTRREGVIVINEVLDAVTGIVRALGALITPNAGRRG